MWLLTGFWHGASWNYLIWGIYYGIILLIEKLWLGKKLETAPNALQHIYSIFFILLGWVIFAFEDLSAGVNYLGMMFGTVPFINGDTVFKLVSNLPMLVILTVASTPLMKNVMNSAKLKKVMPVVIPILAVLVLLLSNAYLVD